MTNYNGARIHIEHAHVANYYHRADRVPGFFLQASALGPPAPHPQASVAPPPPFSPTAGHLLAGEWAWGANYDEGIDTLVL